MEESSNSSNAEYPTGEVRVLTWGTEKISVSSDGFIRENQKEWKRPTKPDPQKNGHVYTSLTFDRNGERRECSHSIARILAEAFCEKKDGQTYVKHIDKNNANNVISNLKWATKHEISINANNSNDQNKKIVYKYDLSGNPILDDNGGIVTFESAARAAESSGAKSSSSITNCCNGKTKSSYGFEWSYLPEPEYKISRDGMHKKAEEFHKKTVNILREKSGPRKETGKKVFVYKNGTLFGEYKNSIAAGEATGCNKGNISKCISGKMKQTNGFTFSRTKTSEEEFVEESNKTSEEECVEESPNKKMRVE